MAQNMIWCWSGSVILRPNPYLCLLVRWIPNISWLLMSRSIERLYLNIPRLFLMRKCLLLHLLFYDWSTYHRLPYFLFKLSCIKEMGRLISQVIIIFMKLWNICCKLLSLIIRLASWILMISLLKVWE